MKLGGFALAAELFGKDQYISAEHDEVWVGGPTPDELGDSQLRGLEEAGWHWDEDVERWHGFC